MENSNLLLLCNTSESDVKDQEPQAVQEAEPMFVKVKVEAEEKSPEAVSQSDPTYDNLNCNIEANTNNNRLSYEGHSALYGENQAGEVQPSKSAPAEDNLPIPGDSSLSSVDVSGSGSGSSFEISLQGNSSEQHMANQAFTPPYSTDAGNSDISSKKPDPGHHAPENTCLNSEANQIPRQVAINGESFTAHQSAPAPACELSARKDLTSQFYLADPSQGMEQRNMPMYMPVEGNFAYDSVPGMDTLADTAVLQMTQIQQQAFEQAQMDISQQAMGRAWNNAGSNSHYGFPMASSTPEVDSRRFSFTNADPQIQSDASLIQAYQALQSEQEQINWMANHIAGLPASQQAILYEESTGADRNWNIQQTSPMDMTPGSSQPNQETRIQSQVPTAEKARRGNKRAHNSGNMDDAGPAGKVAKEGPGENYQISTNVHTLKPRHMVGWYIDHLIQENENITQISKSYTVPVNILNSKDMYFMDSVLKRTNFPSRKFLEWMQGNFPNINIHAIDFSEGQQPYFYIPYEEQLRGKERNDIINDVFFYFQHKAMR